MEQSNQQGFVDIHTHILPGVDDGAADLAGAMKLLRMAHEDGTSAIVLTPHYRGRYRRNTPQQLRERYDALCDEVRKELPDLHLYLGNEAGWERELGEKMVEERVLTLNDTPYVLLEFEFGCRRAQMLDGVMEVVNCGYTPIIAHVERYDIFRKDKRLADEVLSMGALLQINADSVLGKRGFSHKRCCRRLLKRGQVHFIASDAHDPVHRPPLLRECFTYISKRYGEDYARLLLRDNAQAMLSGQWR